MAAEERCGEPEAMIWLGKVLLWALLRVLYALGIVGLLVWVIKQALES